VATSQTDSGGRETPAHGLGQNGVQDPVSIVKFETPVFLPHRWFRGGHVQTLASFLLQRRIRLPKPEERLVEVAPGIKVRCLCYWQSGPHLGRHLGRNDRRAALTLIVVHGLEGSTDSQYMRGVARNGLHAGMNVVLMNQRNCGGMDAAAPTLYNSGLSGDVAAVAHNVVESDGVSRFALIGFSMGGNLVLKLAGEWGSSAPSQFRAVIAVCPAMDLAASADALHEPSNRLYEYYFLLQLFRRFRRKARLFPAEFYAARLKGISSLREFDDRITAFYCGFTGADDYYARAAASNVVDRIAVPALIVHAANDPFIRVRAETRERIAANPNITFIETSDGGHCAFLGQRNGLHPLNLAPYDGRWAERTVVEFVRQCV
jgi:predicted alpha/beta-fold hydrolase